MTAAAQQPQADMQQTPDLEQLAQLLNGFGHDIRIRIIMAMRDGKEKSPSSLQLILGDPLGVVSYHVRMLRQYGLVKEVRQEPRRGALEHFYVLTPEAKALERLLLRRPLKIKP